MQKYHWLMRLVTFIYTEEWSHTIMYSYLFWIFGLLNFKVFRWNEVQNGILHHKDVINQRYLIESTTYINTYLWIDYLQVENNILWCVRLKEEQSLCSFERNNHLPITSLLCPMAYNWIYMITFTLTCSK